MEGANILSYPLGYGDGDSQNNSLFYSGASAGAPGERGY
jgi:hypothetical protein